MPTTITETKTQTKFDLTAIQQALRENRIDGWLFYDHHHRDPLAYSILGLDPNTLVSRRWYYFIPAEGEPKKLVHRIESFKLDTLPGSKNAYSSWQELESQLQTLLGRDKDRDAVLPPQRHHVCLHGLRRHHRTPPLLWQRTGHFR